MFSALKISCVLGLALSALGCHSQQPEPQNVLLVTLDTTRADRLGCYGREQAQTPNLDQLAQEGVLFENAFSTAGLTPMSHASILTGLNNYSHGLRVFYGELGHRLEAGIASLPEILAEGGWRTAAFVSAYPVSAAYGLDRGYQHFQTGLEDSLPKLDLTHPQKHGSLWRDGRRNKTQRRSDATTDQALTWLDEFGEKGPWHVWVHYFDVHDFSLVPPAELAEAAGITYDKSATGHNVEVREQMYAFELSYVDQQFGRLVEYLKRSGQYDHTLIVVVADHGQGLSEGLDDHGWMLHRLLYNWSLHVPLILKLPKQPGNFMSGEVAVNDLVRTVDILPTILEQVGLVAPAGLDGRSLLPLIRGELDEPRLAYADALNLADTYSPGERLPQGQNDNLYVAMDRRWKLIYHATHPENSQLFQIEKDPRELNNLYAKRQDVSQHLMKFLTDQDAFRLQTASAQGPAPDPSALNDLGYTGSK